jgi:protein-S-isoprenylcysteine O-methyltransferase Ste14
MTYCWQLSRWRFATAAALRCRQHATCRFGGMLQAVAFAVVFIVVSAALFHASRGALKQPGSHGFYRFFAWECILGLVLLNLPVWGEDPLAPHQLLSWLLLVASAWLPVHAYRLLKHMGQPTDARQDDALFGFEKTSALVTNGAFHYIRHPMYTALICLAWGAFLKQFSWLGLMLVAAATALLFITALRDEQECIQHFGETYREYMRRTRRFIPYLL